MSPKRRWGRDQSMGPLSEVLRSIPALSQAALPVGFADAWRRAVPELPARHARPGSLRGGELTVHVDTPRWTEEFELMAEGLAVRLREEGLPVDRLLVVGPPPGRRGRG